MLGTVGFALPAAPLALTAGLGFERGAFDEVEHGGKWDWSLGAEAELNPAKIGLHYVDSDAGDDAVVASLMLEL